LTFQQKDERTCYLLNGKGFYRVLTNFKRDPVMSQTIKCIKDFPPVNAYKYDEDLWHLQHGDAFVIINCCATDIYYPEHWTPLSIKCAFNGKEYYKLKNTTYAVSDNNFLVMNQGGQYASYIPSGPVTESFTLNFTQENLNLLATVNAGTGLQLLDDPFKLIQGRTTFIEKLYPYNSSITLSIRRIKSLISCRYRDNAAITEILYGILNELFRLNDKTALEADAIPAKKRVTREELYKRLTIVKDYISSCYPEEITLEHLSATCYLNPFHLLREFKKLYHITPHQYLIKTRLQEAERMIATSQKPIIRVLQEVGFSDPASFGKLFKKQFGVSPGAYRTGIK
jgi:AraC family transcriptional regulator